jgi:hypothetical protein
MAEDLRTKNKPKTNDGSLPIMKYDYKMMPKISENIWHAQMTGWDTILTYDHVSGEQERRRNRSQKRYYSIIKEGVIRSRNSSADEYPFASTVENAGSVFIGHAPEEEQKRQGGLINAFYMQHKAAAISSEKPFWFEVKVINYPLEKEMKADKER